MERADDSSFYQRPEAFNRLSVDVPMHVLAMHMMHHRVREVFIHIPITRMVVGRNQTDFVRYHFGNEAVKGLAVRALNHAGDYVSLALHGPDHDSLAMSASAAHAAASTWPFVLVLGLAADIGFINLNVADELLELDITESHANLAAHQVRGVIGTEAHHAVYLKGTDTFLAGQHHMHDAEPVAQRLVGVLEDRAYQHGKAVANGILGTLVAVPMKWAAMLMDVVVIAARAANAIGPAIPDQIRFAGILMREKALKLSHRHLVDLQVLGFGHGLRSYAGSIRPR